MPLAGAQLLVEEDRWQAVVARDPARDGDFVFGVQSTGVYCRPSCPARRPLRRNVRFFVSPMAAEMAGFRACKRCRPSLAAEAANPALRLVRQACEILAVEPEAPSLDELGVRLKVSPHHLQRTFRRLVGVSPREYAEAMRFARLRRELKAGRDVTGAVYEAGFGSPSRVYERSAAALGMTPATYGRGGAGARIRYTTVASPLGRLLVAATDAGVCFVCLGENAEALEMTLRAEFPHAELDKSPQRLAALVDPVVDYLHGRLPHVELPVDVRATAFQRLVWQELRRIPAGATRTYTEIAQAIGHPRAVRAVANACASNPVALVVPCHRVVPAAGGVGGYRWGAGLKERLLDAERRQGAG
jgi:AraC family transcriptional regulator of adaptative response/methylated-DNA-[protein]-cysteine methyltransferase